MSELFNYTTPVTGKNHIGRKGDSVKLANLLSQGEHVVISAPSHSGKRSLLQQTFFNMKLAGSRFAVAQFSLYNLRDISDIVIRMGETILRAFFSTPLEYSTAVSAYFEGTHFVFDTEAYSSRDAVLSLNWDMDDSDIISVMKLPFRLATDQDVRLFLVFEEFQNVMFGEDGERFCNLFEQVLKETQQKTCSVVFAGSLVNAMEGIFHRRRMFFRIVNHLSLSPIDTKELVDHMVRNFLTTGKVLDNDKMLAVADLLKGHPWYITHYCAICDSLSRGFIMEQVLHSAMDELIAIHETRFINIMNDLTSYQVSLLKAILDGNVRFSSSEVINRYKLNSSANVKRLKDALMKKEIVSFGDNDEPLVLDPLFEYWAKKYFFRIAD